MNPRETWLRCTEAVGGRRRVRTSGFVDPEWYRRTYPDVAASGADPVSHFLRHGYREGRDPGPLFDGSWYLERHPDVARHHRNPLLHYLSSRRNPRVARTQTVAAPEGCENLTVNIRRPLTSPGRLAVMVHAYYPDVFTAMAGQLCHIPIPFTLLISVPSNGAREEVMAAMSKAKVHARADVRVCPNRGRNFAPLVAEFSDEILRHDLVLHLHTKKSLYLGYEHDAWRDHLVESLLGSPARASAILGLFHQDPTIGTVFPTTEWSLPCWAHHWLKNEEQASALFSRLGIGRPAPQGYFDYPVGGMFWARVDAIRPLVDGRFSYSDFPEESGQTDGTLAHALERSVVPLVLDRSYRFVEVDKDTGAFQLDWGSKNLHHYEATSISTLKKAIDRVDLVSFDLFDTLLTRPSVRPDSVLRAVGAQLEWDRPGVDDFFVVRKQAEEAARTVKQGEGDVCLDEIYGHFPRNERWSGDVVSYARALELGIERAVSRLRPSVADALRYAHQTDKRVIALSDTYYSRPEIEELLRSQGILSCFDDLYLSSEFGARKDRGDLWERVQTKEGVAADRWLHIGDNERSDIQAAADRKLHVYHCMNPTLLLSLRGLDLRGSSGDKWGNDVLLGPTVLRFGAEPFLPEGRFRPLLVHRPEDLGYGVFGPVVMAFLCWLARHPARGEVGHLYFCAREGYLLHQAWERLRAAGDPELPESTYLSVSRRTVIAAAQGTRFDPERVLEGWGFNGPLGQLLESRLGLRLPEGSPHRDRPVVLPDCHQAAEEALRELEPQIVEHGVAELQHYLRYLTEVGLTEEARPGLVDIGYTATIQRNLQRLTGQGMTGFYLATVAKASDVRLEGGQEFGCFEQDAPPWTPESPFFRLALTIEAFLMAPHGQLDRVEVVDGVVRQHRRPDPRESEELEIIERMQAGALDYCTDVLDAYGPALTRAPIDPAAMLRPVELLADGRIACPSVASHLVVDDDFCGMPRLEARSRW